ncbi:hypothetical protein ACXYL9_00595 [Qipengyuania sp. CAU 1752]
MKKSLMVFAAASMALSSTVANAATRPQPTEFNQPIADESQLGDEDDLGVLLLLGGAALIGIILALASGNGNSPR